MALPTAQNPAKELRIANGHKRKRDLGEKSRRETKRIRTNVDEQANDVNGSKHSATTKNGPKSNKSAWAKKRKHNRKSQAGQTQQQLEEPLLNGDLDSRESTQRDLVKIRKLRPIPKISMLASTDYEDAKVNGSRASRSSAHKRSNDDLSSVIQKDVPDTTSSSISPLDNGLSSPWTLSIPVGGRFLAQASILTPNEKTWLVATESAVIVFSTVKKGIICTFPTKEMTSLTCYALSKANSDHVFVCSTSRNLTLWSIKSKTKVQSWNFEDTIYSLLPMKNSEPGKETILALIGQRRSELRKLDLNVAEESLNLYDSKTLLRHDKAINTVRVDDQTQVLVAATNTSLLIGQLPASSDKSTAVLDQDYQWREIQCTESPTSLDILVTRQSSKPKSGQQPYLMVAYGGAQGHIYVYQDLLQKLASKQTQSFDARELHWHRESIGDLAFSKDGNYLISGGSETVIVLWQLDTGRKEFLPHLESPIISLTVSPSGTSYAVGLADNSFMTISTSELKPTAHLAGLQSPSLLQSPSCQNFVLTKHHIQQAREVFSAFTIPALINPRSPNQLLLPVSGAQSTVSQFPVTESSPHVQTFDLLSGRHLYRQTLARGMGTDITITPSGDKIREANISQLAMSRNGRWLATVDQWQTPLSEVENVVPSGTTASDQARQREVHLRFWLWDEEKDEWTQNSRISNPHDLQDPSANGTVLNIIADPHKTIFYTVGEDATLRAWSPWTRMPNGRVVHTEFAPPLLPGQQSKRTAKKTQTSWMQLWNVALEKTTCVRPVRRMSPNSASIATSGEGSIIAVHLNYAPLPPLLDTYLPPLNPEKIATVPTTMQKLIHFVDVERESLLLSRADLVLQISGSHQPPVANSDHIHNLEFLTNHLLVLTTFSLTVVHLGSFETVHQIPLSVPRLMWSSPNTMVFPPPHLAVNQRTNSFAVSTSVDNPATAHLPNQHPYRAYSSNISIYRLPLHSSALQGGPSSSSSALSDLTPEFATFVPRLTLALLSAGGKPESEDRAPQTHIARTTQEAKSKRNSEHEISSDSQAAFLAAGFVVIDSGANLRTIRPDRAAQGISSESYQISAENPSLEVNGDLDINGTAIDNPSRSSMANIPLNLNGTAADSPLALTLRPQKDPEPIGSPAREDSSADSGPQRPRLSRPNPPLSGAKLASLIDSLSYSPATDADTTTNGGRASSGSGANSRPPFPAMREIWASARSLILGQGQGQGRGGVE